MNTFKKTLVISFSSLTLTHSIQASNSYTEEKENKRFIKIASETDLYDELEKKQQIQPIESNLNCNLYKYIQETMEKKGRNLR